MCSAETRDRILANLGNSTVKHSRNGIKALGKRGSGKRRESPDKVWTDQLS